MNPHRLTRREFLASSAFLIMAAKIHAVEPDVEKAGPIIDIHQHTNYSGRTDEQLIAHQRAMGITQTILLPAGTPVDRPSTHNGKSNGLAAQCGGNETALSLHKALPKEFIFGANEVTDLPEARTEIAKCLKLGAVIIGEQKFAVDCDSPHIEMVAELAQEYRVPVLLHFQFETYNLRFERFHKILEKYPKVNFIGHAQTWWANIDKNHTDQSVLYPKTKVTPGGLTDRWLTQYPNLYGDLSAGSGLNALLRDEDHTRGFLERHQDKLLYGSDCNDTIGRGPGCQGAQTIVAIRRLSASKAVERKLLHENAKKLFRL
jgi:predicted TIM-barrel fold metal-dependent hydrolase